MIYKVGLKIITTPKGIAEDIDVINLQRQIKDKEDDSATATNKLLKAKNVSMR